MAHLDFKAFKDGIWYDDLLSIDLTDESVVSESSGKIEIADIVQFTGVRDSNRNKIYEFDIVKIYSTEYTVRFKRGAFIFDHPTNESQFLSLGIYAKNGKIVNSVSNKNHIKSGKSAS